jgi:DNA-directed RNA polymerase subunit RPC12/RpoP
VQNLIFPIETSLFQPMNTCPVCHKPHPEGHKGKRARRCKTCISRATVKNRHDDAQRQLHHRFYNNCRNGWLNKAPSSLWSPATVQYVCQRWSKQSVISKASDMTKLRIVPFYDKDHGIPKAYELVLVTESEAHMLRRATGEARAAQFPPEVIQRIQRAAADGEPPEVHAGREENDDIKNPGQ